jgi:hypothetical protein
VPLKLTTVAACRAWRCALSPNGSRPTAGRAQRHDGVATRGEARACPQTRHAKSCCEIAAVIYAWDAST